MISSQRDGHVVLPARQAQQHPGLAIRAFDGFDGEIAHQEYAEQLVNPIECLDRGRRVVDGRGKGP